MREGPSASSVIRTSVRREGASAIRIISVLQDDYGRTIAEECIAVHSRSNVLTVTFCLATRCRLS